MTRPAVSQVTTWRGDALAGVAGAWDQAAATLQARADAVEAALTAHAETWWGSAARAAAEAIGPATAGLRRLCRALILAAAEARDAAVTIGRAREEVVAVLTEAAGEGCRVADDGAVAPPTDPSALVVTLAGGTRQGAEAVLGVRSGELTRSLRAALDRFGQAESAAARAIDAAFHLQTGAPAAVRPAGAVDPGAAVGQWPGTGQERIAAQLDAMGEEDRQRLIDAAPQRVGNTDGVPWEMRVAANRVNVANAILYEQRTLDRPVEDKLRAAIPPGLDPAGAERMWAVLHADPGMRAAAIAAHDAAAHRRAAFYRTLLADVPDPLDPTRLVPRQLLAFDPGRSTLIELSGDLGRARAVGVLVPGLNTTLEGSADEVAVARRFVAGSGGDVAMITYLGGPFPTGELAAGLAAAADPRYALGMAPRLVAFSEDVDRVAGDRAVTYLGHSYGGSIVGTAERLGLTADRVIYVEAAGAGVGVHDPSDWHNRNPAVLRFSLTAPGDWIELVQGIPFGPHGGDPDTMPGVIPLAAGRRLSGRPMIGPSTHSDVLDEPSEAWRNILAVIAGDRAGIRVG